MDINQSASGRSVLTPGLSAASKVSRQLLLFHFELALSSQHNPSNGTMSLPSKAATSLVRHATRQQLPALRSSAAAVQRRNRADASTSHAEYTSPFHRGTRNEHDTTVIPSFGKYKRGSETSNKMFQYFMVGAFGGLSALGAKNTVQGSFIPHPAPPQCTNLYGNIVT